MTFDDFRRSLADPAPPAAVGRALHALWLDGQGDWPGAHALIQEADDADSAWVHAYLHRKEGDLSNAGYWYRQVGKLVASGPAAAEWEAIVTALLAAQSSR